MGSHLGRGAVRVQRVRAVVAAACAALALVVVPTTSASAGLSATPPTLYGGLGGQDLTTDLYVIDPATGATTSVGPAGVGLTGLAFSPIDNTLYGVDTTGNSGDGLRQLVRIDPATGAATAIGLLNAVVADITFTPDGTLYGWAEVYDGGGDALVTIDVTTGAASLVGDDDIGTSGTGLAYDPAGDRLLLAGQSSLGSLYEIDRTTGQGTVIATLADSTQSSTPALAVGCDGVLYVSLFDGNEGNGTSQLGTIDPDTGQITRLGSPLEFTQTLDALAWNCPAEPITPAPIVLRFTG
jgi:hypothetical protein